MARPLVSSSGSLITALGATEVQRLAADVRKTCLTFIDRANIVDQDSEGAINEEEGHIAKFDAHFNIQEIRQLETEHT